MVRLLLLLALLLLSHAAIGTSLSSSHGSNDEEAVCGSEGMETCHDNNNHNNHYDSVDRELHQAVKFQAFLDHMFEAIESHAATLTKPNLSAQESHILTTWLKYMKMDPSVITTTPAVENWLETLYLRTKELAPDLFFKVWDERARPTHDEINVLLQLDDSALQAATTKGGDVDENVLMNHLFLEFRHRGFTFDILDTFCRVVLGPLKTISYAIPSQANLELMAQYTPIIEVGAGTGYWSAMLRQQQRTKDNDDDAPSIIIPYDYDPPVEGQPGVYFDRTYTNVQKGSCLDIFGDNNNENNNHTLLFVWPNNPDNIDNAPEFHSPRLPPVWDLDCLKAFLKAGGTKVILVAERETNIHVLPSHPQNPTQPDSGLCASRAFQKLLQQEFDLVHQMDILTWYYNDDLTVWMKKEKAEIVRGDETMQ